MPLASFWSAHAKEGGRPLAKVAPTRKMPPMSSDRLVVLSKT